jgi:uncharacterized membrane protein
MNWFYWALLSPALMAMSNHFDKYLLEKYFKTNGSLILIIISTFSAILFIPIAVLMSGNVFNITGLEIIWLIAQSIVQLLAIWIYLYVLKESEASIVVPFFQFLPIFYYILSYIFLGETLTLFQITGSLVIMAGALILSLEIQSDFKVIFKYKLFWLMLLSSLMLAISGVIFKNVALEASFWTATFWDYVGWVLFSLTVVIFTPKLRLNIKQVFKENKLRIISLNTLNESIYLLGELTGRFAGMLAPLALVEAVSGFQPAFVFIFGSLLAFFFPRISQESLSRKDLIQKIVAIVIIVLGSVLINR